MKRKRTGQLTLGGLKIGGGAPVVVQSMTKTDTRDVSSTVSQIKRLESAGCEVVRVAVPDSDAAGAIRGIRERINIPIIADVHFDYRLALEAIENGADGLRIKSREHREQGKGAEGCQGCRGEGYTYKDRCERRFS